MPRSLPAGFIPPDYPQEPTRVHFHERVILEDPSTGALSMRIVWSYGYTDEDGNYAEIGQRRSVTKTGAQVVAATAVDAGQVKIDLDQITEDVLLADGFLP